MGNNGILTDGEREHFQTLTSENIAYLRNRYNKVNRWVVADMLRRSRYHFPDKTALVFKDKILTYTELEDECNQTANALLGLGVKQYDRVAILARNTHHHVLTWMGCAKAGAVYLAVNYLLGGEEIAYCIKHSESTVFVVEDDFYPLVKDILPGLSVALIWSSQGAGSPCTDPRFKDFDAWYRSYPSDEPDTILHIEDPVQLTYTSGTESLPKGVITPHQALIAQYMGCIIDGGYDCGDININALPLYHCAQRDVMMNPVFWVGGTNVLITPEIETILSNLDRYKATMFFAPPTVWIGILHHPRLKQYDLSHLKKCYYGASIMPVEVLKEIMDTFPGVKIYNYYGQTELAPYHTILKADDATRKLGSAGMGGLNMETRLEDDFGNPVMLPDLPGEICGKGPHAMSMYFKEPDKTEEVMKGGWFHSGDLGILDAEQYITVVDRKKDMVKTGGENVSTREVEEVIYQDKRVREVAVVGIPHPKWVEAVAAVIVAKAGEVIKPEEIVDLCKKCIANFKVPKQIFFVDELPKSPSGKILKRELRDKLKGLFE